MRRGYPTCPVQALAPLVCAAALVLTGGCSSGQQSGIPNPFISADRVPAPATRAVPMGSAQPYYPNDAVPAFQGGGVPAATPWGSAQSDITPIPGSSMTATGAPSNTTPGSGAPNSMASNEPAIAVPTDSSELRFASLPAPATRVDTQPLAGATTPTISGTLPPRGAEPAATTFAQLPSVAITPAVNSLPSGATGPQVTLTPVANDNPAAGAFRDPVAPEAGAPAPFPSDGAEVPRIRLPQSSESLQVPVTLPGDVRTMSYQIELPPVGSPAAAAQPAATTPTSVAHPTTLPGAVVPGVAQLYAPTNPYPGGTVPGTSPWAQPASAPAVDGFQPRGEARRRAERSAVQGATQASFAVPVQQPQGQQPRGQQTFGYGASYEWLQGRLEYSAAVGHWTLRYMPVGGPTDSFGGSVAIYNSDQLVGLRPGDFVTLQGQLVAPGADPSLPVAYSVYTVERQ